MARATVRFALCVVLGLVAGRVLGPLFVPDPTGPIAAALAVGVAVLTGGALYRSDWLRGAGPADD